MWDGIGLSIIIPCKNEAENLPQLVGECWETIRDEGLGPAEILIVDDGSTDGTWQAIQRLDRLATDIPVHGIRLSRNFGQSTALAAGFDHAKGDILVPMDGDLQNDPRDIPNLLKKLDEGYDCVSGWRKERDDPWGKRLPSRVQTALAKATGPDINDFGCTLKAYRHEAIEDIDLYGEGHRYIPAKLYDRGYSVTEVEVNHRPRKHGSSRYGTGRLVRGFVDLLFHWFWVRYSTRPMHLFGGLGLAAMGTGVLIGGFSVLQKYLLGVSLAPRTPRLVLVALLVIFGLQLVVFGAVAEMLTKLHYRDDDKYRIDSFSGFERDEINHPTPLAAETPQLDHSDAERSQPTVATPGRR